MRVGIDGSCWANRRGFGRFTRCLVGEMLRRDSANSYLMVLDSPSREDPELPALPPGIEVMTVDVSAAPARAAAADGRRRGRDMLRMSNAARRTHCDVFFFPASYSYYPVIGPPIVVTVHDAIAERFSQLVLPTKGARLRWTLKQRLALRQARQVLTVSDASRVAVVEALRVPPSKLHVIPEAPAEIFRPLPEPARTSRLARFGLGPTDRYLLYVGGISPHKNLEVLVEAFEHLAARHHDVRLLLVGDVEGDPFLSAADSIRAGIAASPAGTRVALTGYVSDEELVALYGGAVATVLPSLAEGFGLPAAESAACGTPVVASRAQAIEELLGDAGLYADAHSADAFARHFDRLLTDGSHRDAVARAISARAARWSWATAAETTIDVLAMAARGRE